MKQRKFYIFLMTALLLMGFCSYTVSAGGVTLVSAKKAAALQAKGEVYWAAYTANQQIGEPVSVAEYQKPLAYILQYPKTGQETVDTRIESIVQDVRNAFDQEYLPQTDAPETIKQKIKEEPTLYLGYETYLADNDQMTLVFFETHETNASVSPHTQIRMFHFDLTAGEEIPAEDLMWQDFAKNASVYTKNYFTTTEPYQKGLFGDYETLLAPEAGRFDRFALTTDGVLFYFDRYDLFPGSYGIVSLLIPYEDMQTKAEEPPVEEEAAEEPILPSGRLVALTFDDGPHPRHTNAILDTLEKYNVKATFFDLGSLVERYPDVVRREAALGCEVGSHSYDHKNFNKLSSAQIAADVKATDAAFQKVLGKAPASFRPPYGNCNTNVKNQIPLPIYLWSVDTLDWKNRNADAIMGIVQSAGDLDGKVILMHGIYESSAEAAARLVPYLLEQGYELVTVSELVQAKYGETPQASKLYGYSYFQ